MPEPTKDQNGPSKASVVKLDCQNCLRTTNHIVLTEHKEYDAVEEAGVDFEDDYQIVKCSGCERISFRHAAWSSQDWDPSTGEPVPRISVYPYRLAGRKTIDGIGHLPWGVRGVYEETHICLAANANVLGTIGIRAVVEAVCNDKRAKGDDLKAKIEDLVAQGWLSPRQAEFLHQSRILGNVAAHELKPPDSLTLGTALSIIENLLQTVYVLPGALKPGREGWGGT